MARQGKSLPLPKSLEANEYRDYGKMKINIRKLNTLDTKFPIWVAIQECEYEQCISATVCPYYYPQDVLKSRGCLVMKNYLKEVERLVYDNFIDDLDEYDLFRVGMHLIPLYKQLCRLKIVEMSMTMSSIIEETRSGTSKANGILKEIRECIRTIDVTWRELGVTKARREKDPEMIKPARGYYEAMESEALREQGSRSKKKNSKLVRRTGI